MSCVQSTVYNGSIEKHSAKDSVRLGSKKRAKKARLWGRPNPEFKTSWHVLGSVRFRTEPDGWLRSRDPSERWWRPRGGLTSVDFPSLSGYDSGGRGWLKEGSRIHRPKRKLERDKLRITQVWLPAPVPASATEPRKTSTASGLKYRNLWPKLLSCFVPAVTCAHHRWPSHREKRSRLVVSLLHRSCSAVSIKLVAVLGRLLGDSRLDGLSIREF